MSQTICFVKESWSSDFFYMKSLDFKCLQYIQHQVSQANHINRPVVRKLCITCGAFTNPNAQVTSHTSESVWGRSQV